MISGCNRLSNFLMVLLKFFIVVSLFPSMTLIVVEMVVLFPRATMRKFMVMLSSVMSGY